MPEARTMAIDLVAESSLLRLRPRSGSDSVVELLSCSESEVEVSALTDTSHLLVTQPCPGAISVMDSNLTIPITIGTDKLNGNQCIQAVQLALDHGYRSFDTAQAYGNEEAIGEAIQNSSIPREAITITTKISAGWRKNPESFDTAYKSAKASIERLRLSYVDNFLMHGPGDSVGDRHVTWQALEKLKEEGAIKRIGVSNFSVPQIVELQKFSTKSSPAINQMEVSPTDSDIIKYLD